MSIGKINFELAEKLRDAGYPFVKFRPDPTAILFSNRGVVFGYEPLLPELIAACGKHFEYLIRVCEGSDPSITKEWHAHLFGNYQGIGKTPEEAMAYAYLGTPAKNNQKS